MRSPVFLLFVVITFCCWGIYGPLLHIGQAGMGAEGQLSSLRPFICVGIAYFLIAVIFPIFVLTTREEQGHWSFTGFVWSFIAGAVGAIGALGIVLAFKFHGKPVYVMPIVFGCAPVVNTLVTMWMSRTVKNASLLFYVAVATVAIGAAGVLTFKPTPPKPVEQAAVTPVDSKEKTGEKGQISIQESDNDSPTDQADDTEKTDDTEKADGTIGKTTSEQADPAVDDEPTDQDKAATDDPSDSDPQTGEESAGLVNQVTDFFMVFLSLCVTALCWGSYGPVLHKGQAKMGGSRLRPFLCVGIAYFTIAVVGPYFLLDAFPEPGGWSLGGTFWSLLAGGVGAVGALGIIYAFNFGGKPIFVMPLVFGFAPVVNTLTETISKGLLNQLSQWFFLSLLLVILGAVTVLLCAPRGKAGPAKQEPSATTD
ncbi:MAG: hypothetical protein MK108_01815 [Mariniblastus sp.]|nr:hypothetical protein [Mariniblastus sp.]